MGFGWFRFICIITFTNIQAAWNLQISRLVWELVEKKNKARLNLCVAENRLCWSVQGLAVSCALACELALCCMEAVWGLRWQAAALLSQPLTCDICSPIAGPRYQSGTAPASFSNGILKINKAACWWCLHASSACICVDLHQPAVSLIDLINGCSPINRSSLMT